MTFWILTAAPLDGDQQSALLFASRVGMWRVTISESKGGGPSSELYDSFENVQVLPSLGWSDEKAEHQALLYTMHVTVVELADDDYSTFLTLINSRSVGNTVTT